MIPQASIIQDTATPALQRLSNTVAPERRRPFSLVLGRKAEGIYRGWFRRREATTPNKRGWPRQHFWSRLARRTALLADRTTAEQAVVVVADPALNAKVHGATIVPKTAKLLAIPLRAEAYGIRPRSGLIPHLFVLRIKSGVFLANDDGSKLKFFWKLVPRVHVPRDPRALPPAADVARELVRTGESFVQRELRRGRP